MSIVSRDEVNEPVRGFLLTSESDGREQYALEPGVAGLCEGGTEEKECLRSMRLRDGHGSFCCSVVLKQHKLRDPRNGGWAFELEDTGIAGAEKFWFIGSELGTKADHECRGVCAYLFDGACDVDPHRKFLVSEQGSEMSEDTMAVEFAALNHGQRAYTAQGTAQSISCSHPLLSWKCLIPVRNSSAS